MHIIGEDGTLSPVMASERAVPRQDLSKVYALNGAVYVVRVSALLEYKRLFFEVDPPVKLGEDAVEGVDGFFV